HSHGRRGIRGLRGVVVRWVVVGWVDPALVAGETHRSFAKEMMGLARSPHPTGSSPQTPLKDGLSARETHRARRMTMMGFAPLNPSYNLLLVTKARHPPISEIS